jgi:hypothetical protein
MCSNVASRSDYFMHWRFNISTSDSFVVAMCGDIFWLILEGKGT